MRICAPGKSWRMKNHVFRPLFLVFGFVAVVLIAREIVVPDDFGAHEAGYMYGWHRKGNEQEWKDFKVKYQGKEYCQLCHPDKIEMISKTPHSIINCENCHGPAVKMAKVDPGVAGSHDIVQVGHDQGVIDWKNPTYTKHGEDTFENLIDRSRSQCLRCHAKLPYKGSGREWIRGINDSEHNPDMECAMCHNPHSPGLD